MVDNVIYNKLWLEELANLSVSIRMASTVYKVITTGKARWESVIKDIQHSIEKARKEKSLDSGDAGLLNEIKKEIEGNIKAINENGCPDFLEDSFQYLAKSYRLFQDAI